MKANEYKLLTQCIECGITLGWTRAHKHTDQPDADTIKAKIEDAIRGEICEWFDLDDFMERDA